MSRHEGVSCDSCLKGNFRGRRYKCLVCYDYDLCAACYESGATNTHHTTDHPMQCILTRSDFDVYYGGEAVSSLEMPQSYTCPYCSRMGFTDITLQEHVTAEHQDANFEVVCPLCAAMPGGDPNLMTDDFAGHLTLEHRSGPRDLISFLDEPVATRHNVRRMQHTLSSHSGTSRGGSSIRPRRSNMHFSSSGLSTSSPSARLEAARLEAVDPIAELLSQLSGVRRSTSTSSNTPAATQLQQLQMQLQLERQQVNAARQNMERFPRRPAQNQTLREHTSNFGTSTILLNASPVLVQPSTNSPPVPHQGYNSQFLLSGLLEEMSLSSISGEERQERCAFVQELLLSTMSLMSDEETCETKFNKLTEFSRTAKVDPTGEEEEAEEDMKSLQRPSSTTLRGRARQDIQNAKRRAEANRKKKDQNSDPDEDLLS
ncbi:E3 ubiquitin-protein ligase KCMF1-like [Anthonomus grandis grandis]|uniref:E3 ubiquitin-protein ligase KCMF1-like n=1 Tax=Anthonomus grandis grandis TaxID=2921223 RepID=UPI002166B360|nr:E3 ubiquitin-protein ligase KCMF1-like [Anthonomus grandis grandis]